ncbi:MAG: hypothetical protein K0S09_63 [Sphingobacteriaceae bacterium]|jgi:hypothetical protein|nr:hypothetical protein [Sphingobacteriaceae bacterium]
MKKLILLLFLATLSITCKKDGTVDDQRCDVHNGHQLFLGPQGGCYYVNSSGNKTYVDRSECINCR